MINKVFLIGRLTRDVDLRKISTGSSVTNFTVAVDRRMKSPNQPEADFISCVAWGKTAENMQRYLRKGSQVAVEGRIQTRSYDDQTGRKVYVTEVVAEYVEFLDSRRTTEDRGGYQNYGQNQGGYSNQQGYDQGYNSNYGGGYQGGYQQNQGASSSGYNSYQSSQTQSNSGSNPYAASSQNDFSGNFDDGDNLDIADDDLPF
jgi:single-strand DNA-binding protein